MKNKNILIIFLFIIILGIIIFFVHKNNATSISKTTFALDTVVTVTIYGTEDYDILNECLDLCKSYEMIFSTTNKNSELYGVNELFKSSYGLDIPISSELSTLIQSSLYYSNISNGSFDITTTPLSRLWNFKEATTPPSQDDINKLLPLVDYHYIEVDDNSILTNMQGVQLDLGAIAKGYIADQMRNYLISRNIKRAIINLGGNVVCIGSKPNGDSFKVGIAKPFSSRNTTFKTLSIVNKSVVTCGNYERYFEYEDKLYHHILNPKTGYPVDNPLSSVTIISDSSVIADALSTTCYSLGIDESLRLLRKFPNVQAVFVNNLSEITTTPNLVLE